MIRDNDEITNKILEGLAAGKKRKEIAEELGLDIWIIAYRMKKVKERELGIPREVYKNRKTQNDEIDNKILQRLAEGVSQKEIAEELGLSQQRISQRIKKMKERKVEFSNFPRKPKKVQNDEIDNKILKMLKLGLTQKEISNEIGLATQTILQRIKNMRARGVEVPSNPKGKRKIQNDEIDNRILEELKLGKTQVEIGEKLGLPQPTISYRIKKMKERGVKIPKVPRRINKKRKVQPSRISKRPRKAESDEINNKILAWLAEGKTQTEIGEKLGLRQSTISYRIRKMNEKRDIHTAIEFSNITKNEKISNISQVAQDTITGKEELVHANSKEKTRNN